MGRLVLQPDLAIYLGWDSKGSCIIFRLMMGREYLTPPLPISKDTLHKLHIDVKVELADKQLHPWLELHRVDHSLYIRLLAPLHYAGRDRWLHDWPTCPYTEFMIHANGVVPVDPSTLPASNRLALTSRQNQGS